VCFIWEIFKTLRLIVNDQSRDWVTAVTQRLPPRQWGKFAAASWAIKIWQSKVPEKVYGNIFENTYTLSRKHGCLFEFDSSKTAQGRAMTKNWIGSTLGSIKSSWTDLDLSNDQIRRLLKRTSFIIIARVFLCIFLHTICDYYFCVTLIKLLFCPIYVRVLNKCRWHTRILALRFKLRKLSFFDHATFTHIWSLSAPDQCAPASHVNKRPACLKIVN